MAVNIEIPSHIKWLFRLLFILSIFIFTYSIASKFFPQLNLPNFPFYPYIIGYALLTLVIQFKRIFPFYLIIVLLNFGFPTFRGIFFSHFENTFWTIIFTIMFIASNISSLILFSLGLSIRFVLSKTDKNEIANGTLLVLVLNICLYFGLVSPFYLGSIKPGSYRGHVEPEPYKIDHVYEEVLKETTADRELGRRYFLDGKQSAYKGTRAGFSKSIEYYQRAIELIPKFSTAYAEIAYSYASIGKILKTIRPNDKENDKYFGEARKALNKAKGLNPNNPTVFGVEAILEYYLNNEKNAKSCLVKTENLAKKSGESDRVIQAKAMLEKKKDKRVEYLLGIKNIISDSAELSNMLAIAYYQIGNKDKTKQMVEKAILLNPNYGEAYLNSALFSNNEEKIYNGVSDKDADLRETAADYSRLLNWQRYLRISYLVLFIWCILRVFYLLPTGTDQTTYILTQYVRRIKVTFLRYVGFFIVTFVCFELFIHIYRPVNTLSHMFPVKFPFF